MGEYRGWIPPCAIFCGACPRYIRDKDPCPGAGERCRERRCRGIYGCCVEKKGLRFCYECPTFPCSRFKKFATTWLRYGQDLIANQEALRALGEAAWLEARNAEREE